MLNTSSPVKKTQTTPKKQTDSKSPFRYILKKSKRRECTPDSPVKSFTEQKSNRIVYPTEKLIHSEKKNFLTLIEESLNEVSENYYGLLGSQATPDSLFSSIFMDKIVLDSTEINISTVKAQIEKLSKKEVLFI
jgi:hypothetical protein